jgi:hypothetical protein
MKVIEIRIGAWMARRGDEAACPFAQSTRHSESNPTKLDHGQPGCRAD